MSFQQGVTGLSAASRNLEVIGNNVANSSTVGAKASRTEFADVYARAAGAGTSTGLGVAVATVAQQFSQGSITATDNPLDVAINGAGFFQLQDATGTMVYSRNGQFKVDRDGFVTNNGGMKLMAIPVTYQEGQIPGKSQPLQLPTSGIEPKQTSRMNMEVNLDSRQSAKLDDTGNLVPIDFSDATTYNNSTSISIYDAKGQQVSITYFFQKTATDAWNIYATANGEPVLGSMESPEPISVATFPPDGSPPITPAEPLVVAIPATGQGTSAETVAFEEVIIDFTSLTQFGSTFGPTDVSQDGFPPGRLTSISVEDDGTVIGSYSSGQSAPLARVELANFRNSQGLQPLGGNVWARTFESGDPVVGTPGGGNLGLLQSRAVEDSNVDLTQELVNMMVAQRIYQANAQTIKTQDSVLQTLVSLR
ncbi:flagellar hook protein FlgE [Aquabacterium sp. OR-4]|uniref:flagellar hook protein FlgE n=1 Tax=Aquabacterium sp. OR-4 TaxID=2978127 RepID=UPI0021B2F982|nr:flagellar hook protein FlgE [Aquabacterium sp. OR-4]MDT7836192.1 flagellar hook protein FlgE [Aquabacterium sp. OR-4]